ncbi:Uncharacterized protein OS=Solibacter usitatus (strain Ellin6076) GN=Acid_1417 PE=4 SV=1: Prenyltrans_2: DUF362 [Gemmata massiliana]|uniref:DUF362 domain-containing protein n=1 Tax=Gemmata massiliana TaxID=1210884 RepID=A0A6P2CSS4_9BACT|nr:DUF362 domain-containing protein [Gemmata massiliana]VTR91426.1 Uncharacterized protein OS=Solibacter usitatus (strain Ellin6076) GN=Acid_1417 PE=4 SV=1: Prenyltrans_2: DUF362 [Gemmata massiliana]
MSSSHALLTRLVALANPDGGYGYHAGKASHPEPTCLALLALATAREPFAQPIANGLACLAHNHQPDGGYRLATGRPEATWPTPIALFARLALGASPQELKPTIDHILSIESRTIAKDPEANDMANDIDLTLVGWPWGATNFGWVEPTSWACLALRSAGLETHPRVQQGLKLLLDRAFDSGGANYGNRVVLGTSTEPIPGPTAVLLLAVQGAVDHPRVDAAVGYLRMHAAKSTDLEHLAWARIALGVHDSDTATRELFPALDQKILALASDPATSPPRPALAALAPAATTPMRLRFGAHAAPAPGTPAHAGSSTAPAPGLFAKITSKFRGVMAAGIAKLKPLPITAAVHIARAPSYDAPLAEILATQFAHFRQALPLAGKRVVIKPNLVEYRPERVINTDPRVVDAVITLCKQEGAAEVIVAEGPGHWRNVQFLVRESGLGAVLDKHGVRFVDINHDEPVKVLNLGRLTRLDHLYMSRTVLSADVLISLPKLKMHHWAGVTLSLKNLFGTLPGICYGWPKNELHWRGISQSIVDISCTHPANLSIVDGITGMEGDGPLHGTAKHVGALVMGLDPVAVDSTCARIMGLPPERIPTLVYAAAKRVGRIVEAEIPQIGEPITAVATKFELPPLIDRELLPAPKQPA